MAIGISQIHPLFGAEITGVDLTRPVDDATWSEIFAAFNEYSVLLFRDQPIDDDQQVAFSERFGRVETTISANPAGGTKFARQSNLDIGTGEPIPEDDRRMIYARANQMWHCDSSFKPRPSICSLLSARIVPPEGGGTGLASTRAAYDALPDATRRRLDGLVVEFSLAYSRGLVDPEVLTPVQKAEVPPVRHPLLRTNPVNGRKSMMIGAHASHVVGWPVEEGRVLLRELNDFATRPRFAFEHQWRVADLVVWDNRACLHRATPFDATKYRRLMQRTTVADDGPIA